MPAAVTKVMKVQTSQWQLKRVSPFDSGAARTRRVVAYARILAPEAPKLIPSREDPLVRGLLSPLIPQPAEVIRNAAGKITFAGDREANVRSYRDVLLRRRKPANARFSGGPRSGPSATTGCCGAHVRSGVLRPKSRFDPLADGAPFLPDLWGYRIPKGAVVAERDLTRPRFLYKLPGALYARTDLRH
jgi:hypothetical protein